MMKKKIIVGTVAFSLLAGTGSVYAYNQKVLAVEEAQLEQLRVETLDNAENAVDSLYNSTRTMLSDDIEKKIKNAEIAVTKVEEDKAKSQLSKEISKVKKITKIQQEVYSTLENGVLIESVTNKQIEDIAEKLILIKNQNEAIYTHLSEYLSEAKSQLTVFEAAFKEVTEAEKTLNRKVYNSSLTLVDQVKNEVKKNELKKQLVAVNEKLVAMEEEVKRKKEEEEAEKLAVEKANVSQTETKQQKTVTSSVSKSAQSSSNGSSNKSISSNKATNATSNSGSSSNNSSSSKSSSSETSSSKSPSNGSNSSKSSNSSSDGNIATDVKKTGEGKIQNHTREDQTGANTYEKGTFTVPQDYYNN